MKQHPLLGFFHFVRRGSAGHFRAGIEAVARYFVKNILNGYRPRSGRFLPVEDLCVTRDDRIEAVARYFVKNILNGY